MFLLTPDMKSITPALLKGLEPYLLLEFYDFPYLTVDRAKDGTLYLNYYLSGKDDELYRAVLPISQTRLESFLNREITLHDCFNSPENGYVYVGLFNKKGEPIQAYFVNQLFSSLGIPSDYVLEYEKKKVGVEVLKHDFITQSAQKNKILVDVYLQAPELAGSLKYWSLKSFLLPYTELIRSAIFDLGFYSQSALDRNIGLAYNSVQASSLKTTIEINFHKGEIGVPDVDDKNLVNLEKLFTVLNAESESDIVTSLEAFSNKKIVTDYARILRTIIQKDAKLQTKIAAPNQYYSESIINKDKAERVKKVIDEKIPDVEDVEEVTGILMQLDFDKTNPTFAMQGSVEDVHYRGKIDDKLVANIAEKEFQFLTKEYLFIVKTLYRPPTSMAAESKQITLINIIDPTEEADKLNKLRE